MPKKLLVLFNKPILLSWMTTFLNFAGFVFVLPVALTSLNDISFSYWLFLGGVLAAGLILEIAGGLVFTRTLSFSVDGAHTLDAGGNVQNDPLFSFNNVFSSGLAFFLIVGLLSSCLVWVIAMIFGHGYLNYFESSSDFFSPVLALNGCVLAIVIGSPFKAALISKGRIAIQRKVQLVTSVLRLLSSLWALTLYESVSSLFLSYFFTFTIEAVIYVILSKKLFVIVSARLIDFSPLRNFLGPYLKTVAIRVGGYLIMYSSGLVLAKLDPIEASSFLLTMRLLQALMTISVTPVSVLLPKLSRLRVSKETPDIIDKAISLISLGGAVFIAGAIFLITFGSYFTEIFGSQSKILSMPFLVSYVAIMLLEFHHVINSMIYETSNRVPFLYLSLISGLSIFLLSYYLSGIYGVGGVLFAQFIVQIAGNNWYPIYLNLKDWNISLVDYGRLLIKCAITFRFLKIIHED